MADRYTTLQLNLPCRLSEADEWWDEVKRVMGDESGYAEVSITEHTDGHQRLTVHVHESTVG